METQWQLQIFQAQIISGMTARGYPEEFARRICKQIEGFGEYGFPESHATSFALLAYDSAWLKYYEPAAFTCGLLNSQPMGFYAPAQLVRDAKDHDVEVRPVTIADSDWDCTLEPRVGMSQSALRLGLRLVRSLSEEAARRIMGARGSDRLRTRRNLPNVRRWAGGNSKRSPRLARLGP